jgi:hypothetical protein
MLVGRILVSMHAYARTPSAYAHTCCLLDVDPLAVVHQQELVAAGVASNGQAEHGTGTVDAHTSSSLGNTAATQHILVQHTGHM